MLRFHLATQSMPETETARTEMEGALDAADLLLIESRNRIRDLRYETLEAASLPRALAALGEDFGTPHTWVLNVFTRGAPRDLNPVSYEEIYAIAKEALVNAFRHSAASNIEVELSFTEAALNMTVRDNGKGIDPQSRNGSDRSNHWGLVGMRERSANLGAELKISKAPGGGTEVHLIVPGALAYRREGKHSSFPGFVRHFRAGSWKPKAY